MAQFTNQAQLSYNNFVTNSNTAVGEILEVLSATKSALRDSYAQNDRNTYIVSIVNSGTTPITGVSLSDNLGAYAFGTETRTPLTYVDGTARYYINGVQQPAPTVMMGPPLVISNMNIPAGGNALVIYEADVNGFAPLDAGGVITNTATITATGMTPVTADATVTVESEPYLSITKSISPVPVTENGTLTYTFLIQNTGNAPATAEDLAAVSDLFDPILENLTVTFNGVTWTDPTNYTYSEATGQFNTVPGQITVPAATFTQDPDQGNWVITPGVSTLVVTGTI